MRQGGLPVSARGGAIRGANCDWGDGDRPNSCCSSDCAWTGVAHQIIWLLRDSTMLSTTGSLPEQKRDETGMRFNQDAT